jgi:hypothetical protein
MRSSLPTKRKYGRGCGEPSTTTVQCCPESDGSATDGPVHLFIEHESLTAWMPISNSFTHPDRTGTPNDDWRYRPGILFQLGEYEEGRYTLAGIVVHTVAGSEDTYSAGEFSWVNVVSDSVDAGTPIQPLHAFWLYENSNPYPTLCDAVNACQNTDQPFCQCDSSVPNCGGDPDKIVKLDPKCLRLRNLHAFHSTTAILTYWQGPNGYSISASQLGVGLDSTHNAYSATFKDRFKVSVYKATGIAGAQTMTLVKNYAVGEVERIDVIGLSTSPNHGSHHDPGWPVGTR